MNTIMVDDTLCKLKYSPKNGLIVPTFRMSDPTVDPYSDATLLQLKDYLLTLHSSTPNDVRSYLEMHPFSSMDGQGGDQL
jgi:hypothetical protein